MSRQSDQKSDGESEEYQSSKSKGSNEKISRVDPTVAVRDHMEGRIEECFVRLGHPLTKYSRGPIGDDKAGTSKVRDAD